MRLYERLFGGRIPALLPRPAIIKTDWFSRMSWQMRVKRTLGLPRCAWCGAKRAYYYSEAANANSCGQCSEWEKHEPMEPPCETRCYEISWGGP